MRQCVVELAGPAGAGKTTLASALSRQDHRTSIGIDVGRLRLAAGLLTTAPPLARARLSASGRSWTAGELRSLAYLQAWPSGLRDGRVSGLVLLDHGPIFRLASLLACGPPMAGTDVFRRWWRRTGEAWAGLLDGVVWLDAPDELLLRRIAGRAQDHRLLGTDPDTAAAFLTRYREAYELGLDLVSTQGKPVLRIDTSTRSPQQVVEEVRDVLLHAAVGWSP